MGGLTGTAIFRVEVTGNVSMAALNGQFTIVDGTSGLSNLHGTGMFHAVGDSGRYSVTYSL